MICPNAQIGKFRALTKFLFCITLLGLLGVAHSQVPDEVRSRLSRDGVVSTESWIFAIANGPLRGTRLGDEDRQATRAMSAIAQSLCKFESGPGRRLVADVNGFTMVSSVQRSQELEVIMRAPLQTPSCRVEMVEINQKVLAPNNNPVVIERVVDESPFVKILQPDYKREKNITTRILNREY